MDAEVNRITGTIIRSALRVHSGLGPGLFESVYEAVLARDLARSGLHVERQKAVRFEFEGMYFNEGFRADLIVQRTVIVEIKAVPQLPPVFSRQLLTYLRLLDCRVGLLLNFGTLHLRDGIKRVINSASPAPSA